MVRSAWMVGVLSLLAVVTFGAPAPQTVAGAAVGTRRMPSQMQIGISALAISGALGVAVSIGIRRRSSLTRARQHHEDIGRRLWDTVDNGLVVVDIQTRVVEWNPAMERLTGVPRRAALGVPIMRFTILDHPRHRDCLRLALEGVETASTAVSAQDDAATPQRAYYSPLRDESGTVSDVLIVLDSNRASTSTNVGDPLVMRTQPSAA